MRKKHIVMLASLTLLAACTNQSTTGPVAAPSAPAPAAAAPAAPAPAPVAPPPAAPAQISAPNGLPPGVGREAVLKGCGGCHGIGQILPERRSRQEWSDTVVNMITQGAPVSDAEFDQVVNYLATHFGPG